MQPRRPTGTRTDSSRLDHRPAGPLLELEALPRRIRRWDQTEPPQRQIPPPVGLTRNPSWIPTAQPYGAVDLGNGGSVDLNPYD